MEKTIFLQSKIGLFLLALMCFIIAVSFKHALSGDERDYLANGLAFIQHGTWIEAVTLPLYSILFAGVKLLTNNVLLSAKILYVVFSSLIVFPTYYLASQFCRKSAVSYAVILTMLMPGLLVLPLYSGTHPLFVFLAYSALAVLHFGITHNKLKMVFLAGILIGLSYLTRMDGGVYVALICFGLFVCFLVTRTRIMVLSLLIFIVGFIFVSFPWQYGLYLHGKHLVSPIVNKHSHYPTIWFLFHSLLSGDLTLSQAVSQICTLLSLMVRSYSENIASVRLIPIYIWFFIAIGLRQMRWRSLSWLLGVPVLASFSYLLFHVLARYLSPMVPVVSIVAAAGIDYCIQHVKWRKFLILVIFVPLIIADVFYLVYGHPTYQKNAKHLSSYYRNVLNPNYQHRDILTPWSR